MEQLFEDAMRNPAFALAVSTSGGNLDPLRMYDWLTRMRARLDPGSGRTFDDIGAVVHKLHETCLMVATEINLSDEAYRGSSSFFPCTQSVITIRHTPLPSRVYRLGNPGAFGAPGSDRS